MNLTTTLFGMEHRKIRDCGMRSLFTVTIVLLGLGGQAAPSRAEATGPRIGQSEKVYTLAPENAEIRGLAWDETSPEVPVLFVLDHSGIVFAYEHRRSDGAAAAELKLVQTLDLSTIAGSAGLSHPRGLGFAVESGRRVLYFMDWGPSPQGWRSRLWRYLPDQATESCSVDLSLHAFRIGDREVFDLTCEDGRLLISYDASGHADQNVRVQRGILRVAWDGSFGAHPAQVRHLPDAGTFASRGLAAMELDGARYLWGTVGDDSIYCAESRTGRGLFFFERPGSQGETAFGWGLCFGQEALWVSESVPGPDRIHRVNVTKHLDASFEGPRVPRRLIMTIRTDPEEPGDLAGKVYHYYSRPYGHGQLPNQGIWPETETITNLSDATNATIRQVIQDPGGDRSSRQILQCVEYADAPARSYSSRYEIEVWTNPYKKFIYPHRVDQDTTLLQGTDYLGDDSTLYNLRDTATYQAFIHRVRAHIQRKYGVEADMQNPYWAARNVVEYIQDHYYYPSRPKGIPATVDYRRQHYDANPANLKIELSAGPYDKTQIIACSGTSVMVAGAMRHLGIPSRWLGTGTQQPSNQWDANANGLLDPEETAPSSNGHRYTQVWLGSHYGWICFDATPSKPPFLDYDLPPPLQPQWRYMTRAASGHRAPKRIVFNVGSELIHPLYRDFEYDARLAVDNNCGGDQRYNLQGRFEKPERWKLARHRVALKNLCWINPVTVLEPGSRARITWRLEGAWHRLPQATISVHLQRAPNPTRPWRDVTRVASRIPADAGSVQADLSGHTGSQFRVILRRDGDPETGGVSEPFSLP